MLSSDAFTKIIHSFEGGVVILNDKEEVYFANDWFVKASYLKEPDILNRKLIDLYPELISSRLFMAAQDVLSNKLPAILSNSFHPSPLPLFESINKAERIQQLIHLFPLSLSRINLLNSFWANFIHQPRSFSLNALRARLFSFASAFLMRNFCALNSSFILLN